MMITTMSQSSAPTSSSERFVIMLRFIYVGRYADGHVRFARIEEIR